ncbi:hypothetical protein [Nisaea nitritireducens]|uniref:hypothetical protein n=1 Tax=Nisaea nitritireducens TaxID=568392 RepID=UPI0018678F93|nr:hypothetical protein [Nisaea nitritireducens]
MVPDITVLPLPGCAGKALLVCAPTDNTRTGKSVPGGSAVPGFGADAPAAAAPLVAGVFTVCVAGVAADRFSGAPCVTACGVGAALVGCPAVAGWPVPGWLVAVAWPAPVVWGEVMGWLVWPVAAEDAVVAAADDGACDWGAAPPGEGEEALCGAGAAAVLAALAPALEPACTGGPGCRVIAGLPCWAASGFTAGCCACDGVLVTG